MALRVSGIAVGASQSDTVTLNDPGTVAGDLVSLFVFVGGNQARTLSSIPTGFTQITTGFVQGANHGADDGWFAFLSGSTLAASYSVTVSGANLTTPILCLAANSGRTDALPSNYTVTSDTGGNNGSNSPVTITLGGVNASRFDDILVLNVLNNNASWAITPPAGYTNQQTASVGPPNNDSGALNLLSKDNLSPGNTGNIVSTATGTHSDFGGIVVCLSTGINQIDSKASGITGNGPGTIVANTACGPGNLIIVSFALNNVSAGNAGFIPTITDSVNSGTYQVPWTTYVSASSRILGLAYIVANATGTPTITLAGSTTYSGGNMAFSRWSGFFATPTIDGAVQQNSGTSTTPSGVFSANGTNEMVAAYTFGGGAYTTQPSGWTPVFNASGGTLVQPYWLATATPATENFTGGVLNASTSWVTALIGFSSGAPTPFMGWVPASGPGISPNKQTTFSPRVLSNAIPVVLNFGNGFASSYGYGALLPKSAVAALGFTSSYGFALMTLKGKAGLNPNRNGPGVSSDWPMTFWARPLSSQNQQTPAGVIQGNGFSSSYGFLVNAQILGVLQGYGQTTGAGFALPLAILSARGTGFSSALGFGNPFNASVYTGFGYSSGYGRGAGQAGILLMPNVIGLLEQAAITLLQTLGYNVQTGAVYSTLTPPGYISQQTPQAGVPTSFGQTVTIYVSLGQFVRSPNPSLGYRVSSRTFSLEEMVSREWGPEFRAPDHRIYEWSNARAFDSTDLGDTGIYQKGTSTS